MSLREFSCSLDLQVDVVEMLMLIHDPYTFLA